MIALLLGLGLVGLLLAAASAFSNASVAGVKALLAWVAALAGLSLAAMLVLTGRGAIALSGLVLLGPVAWSTWQKSRSPNRPTQTRSTMTRQDALEVLGLQEGASKAEIRAAWLRLMRAAHPDTGGSDWLAARINQAKDILL